MSLSMTTLINDNNDNNNNNKSILYKSVHKWHHMLYNSDAVSVHEGA